MCVYQSLFLSRPESVIESPWNKITLLFSDSLKDAPPNEVAAVLEQPEEERREEAVSPAAVAAAVFLRKLRRVVYLFCNCGFVIFVLLDCWSWFHVYVAILFITFGNTI